VAVGLVPGCSPSPIRIYGSAGRGDRQVLMPGGSPSVEAKVQRGRQFPRVGGWSHPEFVAQQTRHDRQVSTRVAGVPLGDVHGNGGPVCALTDRFTCDVGKRGLQRRTVLASTQALGAQCIQGVDTEQS